MDSSLLASKVHIPPETGRGVARDRLTAALEAGLPLCKLALVAAPAGYGKTTLLAQWARATQYPVAWLTLSAAENDFESFFRYIFSAWEQVQPGIRESALGTLLEGPLADVETVLPGLMNLLHETPGQMAFILDDYHLIENPHIHQALAELLDHLPQTVHFVLSTRADPPLPLARYRARGEVLELRAEDLQFGLEETEEFLNRGLGLDLNHEELARLHAQLEGWAAGLRLVGLRYRHNPSGATAPTLSGRHRFVADYLSLEILDGLAEDLRAFLLETSILEALCGPLCDAVTGQQNGQRMLETLERENLFLVPLDDNRDWYRYHRLFADFLRETLARSAPEQVPDLHRQAARWHLDQDMPEQAYQHALAAGDIVLMAQVFDRYANAMLQYGAYNALKNWLDGLPEDWYTAYPAFGLALAGYLAYTGSVEGCMRVVDEVEKRLEPEAGEDARRQLARVKSLRCFMACMMNDLPRAEAYASQALRDLPEEDLGFRPGIYAALGDSYRQNGFWSEANQCYRKALTFTNSPAVRVQSAHLYGALADLNLRQGRLRQAARYWEEALASAQAPENWGRIPLQVTGWIYTRMAELDYEWNALETAAGRLARGLERAALGGDARTQIAGCLLGARIDLSQGELEKAADSLEGARRLLEQSPFPEWAARFDRCQVELWLAENRLRAAVDWADVTLARADLPERPEHEHTQLAIARILIFKGEASASERALALLERLFEVAQTEGRAGVALETLALQALARWQRGERAESLAALERALGMAEPEGYLRLFADLGLPMGRLLQEAQARGMRKEYVTQLLQAFGSHLNALDSGAQTLPEPLTAREQEILERVAAGLTNREIAEQFMISPETVKKHVGNITGKLGVSNRTEATARARALGLLD